MKSNRDGFKSGKPKFDKPRDNKKEASKDSPFKQFYKPTFEKPRDDEDNRRGSKRSYGDDKSQGSSGSRFSDNRTNKYEQSGSRNPFSKNKGEDFQEFKPFDGRARSSSSEGDRSRSSSDRDNRPKFGGDDRRPRFSSKDDKPRFGGDDRSSRFSSDRRDDKPRFGGEDRSSRFSSNRDDKTSFGGDDRKSKFSKDRFSDDKFSNKNDSGSFSSNDNKSKFNDGGQDNIDYRPKKKLFEDDFFSKPSGDRRDDRSSFSKDRDFKKPFDRDNKSSFGNKDRFESKDRFDRDRSERSFDRGNSESRFDKDRFNSDRGFSDRRYDDSKSGYDKPYKSKYDDNKKDGKSKNGEPESDIIRLNKFVSQSGLCSRRKAVDLIKAGEVYVNGNVELNPAYETKETDVITHKSIVLKKEVKMLYLLMNKPKNVITTAEDEKGRKTVLDIVKERYEERVYPVGRLDRNTTGLLLITNDGDLAKKLSHPSHQVKKFYQVELDKNIKTSDLDKIRDGIMLDDGEAEVDAVDYIEGGKKNEVGVEIHSGKNRIVRRIFEALGYEVVRLDRTYYAGLTKKDLPRGFVRELNNKEIIMLKHFTNHRKKDGTIPE